MISYKRLRKVLAVSTLAAAALVGIVACGDYTYFKVRITSTTTPRNDIEYCRMTITNEAGEAVVNKLQLQSHPQIQPDGTMTLRSDEGCFGGLTNANIGYFSYSTSRSSGSLTFLVEAIDKDENVVQSGTASQSIPCPSEALQTDGTCLVEVKIAKP
jgi:hypothetical protein